MPDPIGWFLDKITDRLQNRAVKNADVIRRVQEETSRRDEQVIRILVYYDDATRRDQIQQRMRKIVCRIRADGMAEKLPPETPADVEVRTDFATIKGLAVGHVTYFDASGRPVPHDNFTWGDAVRLRHLDWTGSSAIRNLALLENKVLPMLYEELGVLWPGQKRPPLPPAAVTSVVCGRCGHLNSTATRACVMCGEPLAANTRR